MDADPNLRYDDSGVEWTLIHVRYYVPGVWRSEAGVTRESINYQHCIHNYRNTAPGVEYSYVWVRTKDLIVPTSHETRLATVRRQIEIWHKS